MVADTAEQPALLMQTAESQREEPLAEVTAAARDQRKEATGSAEARRREESDRVRADARVEADTLLNDAEDRTRELGEASRELAEH